jgi:hypothetical protein
VPLAQRAHDCLTNRSSCAYNNNLAHRITPFTFKSTTKLIAEKIGKAS